MNARRVNAAAGVVLAAMGVKQTAAGIAASLEAAGLLQSPESAAELVALRERVAEREAARSTVAADRDAQVIAWLVKKAGEYRGLPRYQQEDTGDVIARLADKLSRGAVRPACPPAPAEDPHDSPLHHTYTTGRDLPEVTPAPEWSGATELASDRMIRAVAATGLVGYQQNQGRWLHCLAHKPAPASRYADFHAVTADDLDDGGMCVHPRCGRDLLAAWPTTEVTS